MPTMIPDTKVLSFASVVERDTIDQARQLATMPFIPHHVALMPDAHVGKGSSVGTVIPTKGAVIPAAVGVDIGCLDADTEFLSDRGWVRIADWNGHRVMQYEPSTGQGRLVRPERYIVRDQDWFYHLRTKYGVDQMLTPDHKMLVWKITGRNRRREQQVLSAEEFVALDANLVLGYRAEFATTFELPEFDSYTEWDPAWVRVAVMAAADGTMDHGAIAMHLRRERKIERAQKLLNDAGLEYSLRTWGDGSTNIRFRWSDKDLQKFWAAGPGTLRIVADESLHWDGNLKDRIFYTRKKADADLIQYAFTATGRRASVTIDNRDSGVDHRVVVSDDTRVGFTGKDRQPIEEVPAVDGKAYCFTVSSGFLVMRRNGNVFITGNCGMRACRTKFTENDLFNNNRDLTELRDAIVRAIPMGTPKASNKYSDRGGYNGNLARFPFTKARLDELDDLARRKAVDLKHSPKWANQLGSLGGGNHFIELCLDQEDRVWLFLHSGSRGVGNKIAQRHIKIAEKLCKQFHIKLPSQDLAYIPEGTPEFSDYIRELNWAQKFALLNRDEMMDRFVYVLAEFMRVDPTQVGRDLDISCHHNYTVQENHHGQNVWVTRKGAIRAREGDWGLIPGSMGTRSYVVQGKGHPGAFSSAPHGAGRLMSRNKANETFTEEDLRHQMAGIIYRDDAPTVDEIPSAYKDIDQVMEDARDLVEIRYELRQLINVKGD